ATVTDQAVGVSLVGFSLLLFTYYSIWVIVLLHKSLGATTQPDHHLGRGALSLAGLQRDMEDGDVRVDPGAVGRGPEALGHAEAAAAEAGFTFQTYAGPVFASFRSALGMSEQEYRLSLCSEGSYLQFISNSKSKADFFLTNDKRLFLKTQNKREVRFLLDNLKIYMEHLRKYPHSLLVKFLGVHAIKIPHKRKKYFIVMQSVFYPDDRICGRYDIKGSVVSRWTEPSPPGSQVIEVFKDVNFGKKYIDLGQQRAWLLRQMELDTDFLRRLNVLDYSFLLAHQPLHRDEHGFSFGSLIYRTKIKSLHHLIILLRDPRLQPCNPGVPGAVPDDGDNASSPPSSSSPPPAKTDGGYHVARRSAASSDSSGEEDFLSHNRRLLPRFKNPLHVIDGPEQRYFVGIIDIFTVYSLRKRLEHWWKRLRYPGQSFSTVSPPAYCTRLCAWVKDHTK
ncbi:hypothetical protein CRUP_004544, partial [Coryphaenoides rupestris]